MKLNLAAAAAIGILVGACTTPLIASAPDVNSVLTPAETAAGWKLLFDGTEKSAKDNFRAFKKTEFPPPTKGWVVENGVMHTVKGAESGDVVSAEDYGDFELSLEYRCTPGANSGIMYRVTDKHGATYETGPEFQVIDDPNVDVGNGKKGLAPDDMHSAGAIYDLMKPDKDKTIKPAGEWNLARIRIKDGIVQHFLNDKKVAECRVDDQSWKDKIAASKFKSTDGFGVQPRGRIALQHHGDEVAFRNIKIRDLSPTAKMPGEVSLFNGKDVDNWDFFLNDNGKKADVWSVQDGIIICKGVPVGYIRTKDDYTSYVVKVEWRFNPVTKKAGNSGVLLRVQAPDKVWPKCVEAQLESGNAGDFWDIDEYPMKGDQARTKGRNTKHTHAAEHPVGEWNDYEIIVDGSTITLRVNGEEMNKATDVQVSPGKIALQSEGAEIHFRKVVLSPIK